MTTFNAYDKRVTLNLALHSAAAAEKPELKAALAKLPSLGWDVYQLPKEDIELIYAEFDESFEKVIKDEFEADPAFLIDLKHCHGVCPLCGHVGIRWVFKIANHKGGQPVECGSECILVHGLHVKGAETAEHARKALEGAIRRRMRELEIQEWHTEYGFEQGLFNELHASLQAIRQDYANVPANERRSAWYKVRDLQKLERYYARSGWLGTEKKWAEWSRLAKFARTFDKTCKVPFPKEWVKPVTDDVNAEPVVLESALTVVPNEPVQTIPAPETKEEPKADPSGQMKLDFGGVAKQLVFG